MFDGWWYSVEIEQRDWFVHNHAENVERFCWINLRTNNKEQNLMYRLSLKNSPENFFLLDCCAKVPRKSPTMKTQIILFNVTNCEQFPCCIGAVVSNVQTYTDATISCWELLVFINVEYAAIGWAFFYLGKGPYSHSCKGESIQHDHAEGDGFDSRSVLELFVKESS